MWKNGIYIEMCLVLNPADMWRSDNVKPTWRYNLDRIMTQCHAYFSITNDALPQLRQPRTTSAATGAGGERTRPAAAHDVTDAMLRHHHGLSTARLWRGLHRLQQHGDCCGDPLHRHGRPWYLGRHICKPSSHCNSWVQEYFICCCLIS